VANKKALVEIRKGKQKADGPPVELISTGASGGAPCTLCVVAGEPCILQSGPREKACQQCTRMKESCSIMKKNAGPESTVGSDIEIVKCPSKRPDVMKPTQGQVTIDIQASKSKVSGSKLAGSRSRGVDLSEIVLSMKGLAEVRISIQRELWGQ
jgi:hypothetical protein